MSVAASTNTIFATLQTTGDILDASSKTVGIVGDPDKSLSLIAASAGLPGLGLSSPKGEDILNMFYTDEVQSVTNIKDQAKECAKSIAHRLLSMAIDKLLALLKLIPIGIPYGALAQLALWIAEAIALYNKIMQIVEMIQAVIACASQVLSQALAAVAYLTGESQKAAFAKIMADFPNVPGLETQLGQISTPDFNVCSIPDIFSLKCQSGGNKQLAKVTSIPFGAPPSQVMGSGQAHFSMFASVVLPVKRRYDALMYSIGIHTAKDFGGVESNDQAITALHNLAYSYHDNLKSSHDSSQDAIFLKRYQDNVALELSTQNGWSPVTKEEFKRRAVGIQNQFSTNAEAVRGFYNRNASAGEWMDGFRFTAYGHTSIDDQTRKEVEGGVIPSSWQYKGNRGNLLVKGKSVASNYFRHGTLLQVQVQKTGEEFELRVDDSGSKTVLTPNKIDFFCGGDKELYDKIVNIGPIQVKVLAGGIIPGVEFRSS